MLTIDIDWEDAYGWYCCFCGGEIDHLHEDRDESAGYTDDSYSCQDKGGLMCGDAYFVVRWSNTQRGDNGDALTLKRFIEVEIDDKYINAPEKSEDNHGSQQ